MAAVIAKMLQENRPFSHIGMKYTIRDAFSTL